MRNGNDPKAEVHPASHSYYRWFALAASAGLLLVTGYRNAWVTEDAFITFRSVEQLFQGNGPRWNPHERVQVFTHPLWYLLLVSVRSLSADLFVGSMILGIGCSLLSFLFLAAATRYRLGAAILGGLLLSSSLAWVDYATSGLENSLSYALLALTLVVARQYLSASSTDHRSEMNWAIVALGAGALLLLNRHDNLLLVLPLLLLVLDKVRRGRGFFVGLGAAAFCATPLLLWTLFSLFYFGFPLPNTAYAKLDNNLARTYLLESGAAYFLNSLRWDPLTLLTIVGGLVAACCSRTRFSLSIAAGIVLYLLYTFWIGGDYMAGRFFATPFFCATALLMLSPPLAIRDGASMLATLIVLLLHGSHPLQLNLRTAKIDQARISDEKATFFWSNSWKICRKWWREGVTCPESRHLFYTRGLQFKSSPRNVTARGNVGMFGYAAGLEKTVVDLCGLSDPLLARLPPIERRPRIGHYVRALPAGYLESLESGENRLKSAPLRAYFEALRTMTQSPLFASGRFETILKFNLGQFDYLKVQYLREERERQRSKHARRHTVAEIKG